MRKSPLAAIGISVLLSTAAFVPSAEAAVVLPNSVKTILAQNSAGLIKARSDSGRVEAMLNTASGVKVSDSQAGRSLSFKTAGGQRHLGDVSGFTKFSDKSDGSTTLVQPTEGGGQILFVGDSPRALQDFSIELESGVESHFPLGDGRTGISLRDGTTVTIDQPWARDAAGRKLETEFVFAGNRIQQKVLVDSSTQFPVTADPAWNYSSVYYLYKKNPDRARKLLKKKDYFNIVFPVKGAPKNFPKKIGQKLPLRVAWFNFSCIYAGEHYSRERGGRSWYFTYLADKGHIDGAGSQIRFYFIEQTAFYGKANENILVVDAKIKNSNPGGIPRGLYESLAKDNWIRMATWVRTFA